MNKYRSLILLFAFIFVLATSSPAFAEGLELQNGYYTIMSEEGKIIFQTAFPVSVGDMFIDENNVRWVVHEIKGKKAIAKQKGKIDISQYMLKKSSEDIVAAQAEGGKNNLIGIYHTHDDESYQPSDGYASAPKGKGSILKVGEKLKGFLEGKGFSVIQDETSHYPHDGGAYDRSRRTVKQILQKQPIAVFDVHRDAVPPQVYRRTINGEKVSAVTLVVGRQNPNMKANEEFAMQLKSQLDKDYPKLVKGIFYAKGKYNQDMAPRMLLLEFGTHTISREEAERSTKFFADAVPKVLYGADNVNAPGANLNNALDRGGAWKALGWIIGLLVIGGGIFLVISSGSIGLAGKRLGQFARQEFSNYFGFSQKNALKNQIEEPKNESNSVKSDVQQEIRERQLTMEWHPSEKGPEGDEPNKEE